MLWHNRYKELVESILQNKNLQFNERTKQWIYVYPGAKFVSFKISQFLPIPDNRRYYPETAASEVAWILSGEKSISWLETKCKIWTQFANENNEIDAAYGYRIKTAFGRNQLIDAIQALKNDESSRQVVISLWDAREDGLLDKSKSNVPCPTQLIFNIINGELHASITIRSSDIFVGLPYDVMVYSLLTNIMATELGISLGTISFMLCHAHIYLEHCDLIRWDKRKRPLILMPKMTITEVLKSKDFFVEMMRERSKLTNHSSFNPKPSVFP